MRPQRAVSVARWPCQRNCPSCQGPAAAQVGTGDIRAALAEGSGQPAVFVQNSKTLKVRRPLMAANRTQIITLE